MQRLFADVVEGAPAYDHGQLTGVAASHVVYELLSAMAPRGIRADVEGEVHEHP